MKTAIFPLFFIAIRLVSADNFFVEHSFYDSESEQATYKITVIRPEEMSLGDVDGDGDVDGVFVAQDTLVWNENSGNGVFIMHTIVSDALHFTRQKPGLGDFTGDGRSEIVLEATLDTAAPNWNYLVRIGPEGALEVLDTLPSGVYYDVNADGKSDIVEISGSWVYLHYNRGDLQFDRKLLASHIRWNIWAHSAPQCVDFDGDGNVDILYSGVDVSSQTGKTEYVYLNILYNQGGEEWGSTQELISRAGPNHPYVFAIGDFDNDGASDILAQHDWGNYNVEGRLYLYLQGRSFADTLLLLSDLHPFPKILSVFDIAADGDLDVFIRSSSSNIDQMLLNQGGGTFNMTEFRIPLKDTSTTCGSGYFGDFDHDGDIDILGMPFRDYGERISLYENKRLEPARVMPPLLRRAHPSLFGLRVASGNVVLDVPPRYPNPVQLSFLDISGNRLGFLNFASPPAGRHVIKAEAFVRYCARGAYLCILESDPYRSFVQLPLLP